MMESADPMDDPEEQAVIGRAINSYHKYRTQAHYHITHKRRQAFYAMPQKHWTMLSAPPFNMLETFDRIDEAIEKNAIIADQFVASAFALYDSNDDQMNGNIESVNTAAGRPSWDESPNPLDQEKAHQTIRQLYRDWSAEGALERAACFTPVVNALDEEYKHISRSQRGNIKVLVPGAGLGRSVFEISRAGYAVEGNEISYHQVIASNYMLNFCTEVGQFELYPWIHGFSNHLSRDDHLQMVRIPDVHVETELRKAGESSEVHPFDRLSFSSADFCAAYKSEDSKESFDAVCSIFFIDTAPNVIKYVEAVHHCLKMGGVWINLGPLKWHFENESPGQRDDKQASSGTGKKAIEMDDGIGEPGSVELTEDEIMALLDAMGFAVEKHETMQTSTGYIGAPRSMWESVYHPSFWVARKR